MATFSIVALVKEDVAHIRRFASYYRRSGADEIFVYYDGSVDQSILTGIAGSSTTACDDGFWNDLEIAKPASVEKRQEAVYVHALARCSSDWLLIVDCDEFVFGEVSIPDFLDAVPEEIASIKVRSAEAVYGPGDDINEEYGAGFFRLPVFNRKLAKLLTIGLYGETGRRFEQGLLAHAEGKQFLRADRQYGGISLHNTWDGGRMITVASHSVTPALPAMYLGHFDALSFPRWREKWRRRIEGETKADMMMKVRKRQMASIATAFDAGGNAPADIFRRLYSLSPVQVWVLDRLGLLLRRRLDLASD